MAELTSINRISITELIIYIIYLCIASLLAHRQGFGRNAGWLFVILFCVTHIISAALDLASTSADTETAKSLMTGAVTIRNFGPAPLMLCMLSLLGKVLGVPAKKNKRDNSTQAPPKPRAQGLLLNNRNPATLLRIVQAFVMIALLLAIIGGIRHSESLLKGSLGVTFAAFGMLAIAALAALQHVFTGRHRGEAQGSYERAAGMESSPFVAPQGVAMAVGQQYHQNGHFSQGQQYPPQPYDSRPSYDGAQHFNEKAVATTRFDDEADYTKLTAGVVAALPFVLIRLIYAGMGGFAEEESERAENFRQYGHGSKSVVYLAVLAVSMDVVATGILEATGLMLRARKSK